MKRVLFLTLVLVWSTTAVNAQNWQPGVVVLSSGDTLSGKLSLNALRSFTCEFMDQQGNTHKYTPYDLKSFFIPGELYYESMRFKEDDVTKLEFMSVVVSGRADLLEYKGFFYLRDEYDQVHPLRVIERTQKVDGREYVVRTDEYKTILREKLTGCNTIQKSIGATSMSKRPLMKLINQYNSCFGEVTTTKESRLTPKSKFIVGVNYHLIKTELTSISNYWKGKSAFDKPYSQNSPGISLFYSPRYAKGLAFHLGFYKTSYSFQAYDVTLEEGEGTDGFTVPMSFSHTFSGEYNAFAIPLMLQYSFFADRRIQPYVGGGMGLHFISNFKGTDRIYNLSLDKEHREDEIRTYDKTVASIRVQLGVNVKLGDFLVGGGVTREFTNYPVEFRTIGGRYASEQVSNIVNISVAYTIVK